MSIQQIVDASHFLLNNYPEANLVKEYLNSRISASSQNVFQFGYFPESQNISAITDLVNEDVLQETSLFYLREVEDSFSPRQIKQFYFEDYPLIMPFHNIYGQPVALVGRTLLDDNERKNKK